MKSLILYLILPVIALNLQLNPIFAAEKTQATKTLPINNSENISLSDHIKQYNYKYLDTFISTIAVLSNSKITITTYNTSKGEIKARLSNNKELFILVTSLQDNLTQVRITPADGIYDIPVDNIKRILNNIKLELSKY